MIKKHVVALALISVFAAADGLAEILSENNRNILEYRQEKVDAEADKLSTSWISPIYLGYSKSYSSQFTTGTYDAKTLSVSIDQPIFRSGGIYFAMKYAEALRGANSAEVALQKRQMITNAVTILFSMEKTKLQQQKLALQLKNDHIDIRQKRDKYDSGLMDSSFLDQAILKQSLDETTLLELELGLLSLEQQFSLLSDRKPSELTLPTLSMVSKAAYHAGNLELKRDEMRVKEAQWNERMTWAKYLPAVTVQGQYIDGDINPLFGGSGNTLLKEQYRTWGFTVSMPIDINSYSDIESSRVSRLQAATEAIERKETMDLEYRFAEKNLEILDKKIALAQKDVKVYANLYKVTKNLVQAGEKTALDAKVMRNTMQMRKLDAEIYAIDKQIELLKLYARMGSDL